MLERSRVRQRLRVLHGVAVNDRANRQLDDLSAFRPRYLGDGNDFCGNVARRRILSDNGANAMAQRVIELEARAQYDEQHHANVVSPILADRDAFDDIVEFFDLAADLGGTYAYPARVQNGVRAAIDNQATLFSQFGEIAMRPDAVETLEIGRFIAGAVRIVPESYRRGGERLRADQFAVLPDNGFAGVVPDLHRHAETATLKLAAAHG